MIDAIEGGYAFEAAMGGLLFGGLGTLAGVVVGTLVGATFGVMAAWLSSNTSPGPSVTSDAYLGSALVFGLLGGFFGGLIGLGFGAVVGISNGPKLFRAKPPPPPPRAQLHRGAGTRKTSDVFAY